jgi:hypothetical protein
MMLVIDSKDEIVVFLRSRLLRDGWLFEEVKLFVMRLLSSCSLARSAFEVTGRRFRHNFWSS